MFREDNSACYTPLLVLGLYYLIIDLYSIFAPGGFVYCSASVKRPVTELINVNGTPSV
jgi:hypothetical protein